jgi:pectinesterase
MSSRLLIRRFGMTLALLSAPACSSSETGGAASGGHSSTGGSTTVATGGIPMSSSGGASAMTGGAIGTAGGSGAIGTAGGSAGVGSGGGGGIMANGGAGGAGGSAGLDPKTCPAQTMAVTPSGSAGLQAPGAAIASSATRPQLTQAEVEAKYTILESFAHGGEFSVAATVGGSGGASAGGVTGSAGVANAGNAGNANAGNAGSDGSAGTAGGAGNAGGAGTAGSSAGSAAGSAGTAGSSSTAGAITYTVNDNWDPVTNGIGDVNTFVPGYTVASDGSGTHTTIQAAITEAVYLAQCPRVYIRIKAGTYRETITVPNKTSAPPLTLYSTESDASKTVIVNNVSAASAASGSISASATFTQNLPRGFQAKNLTIANDYVEDSVAGPDQAAVALLNQGDRSQYENVRVLGNRYTLYIKSQANNQVSRVYFRDSYIEGDESFIAGRGTPVFDHCEIHSLGSRKPTGGVIGAPSTELTNPHGFLFVSSQFTAEASATGVFLGQQWFEGNKQTAVGKMIVRNSTLGAHIQRETPWSAYPGRVTPKDPMATTAPILYTSNDYYPAAQAPTPPEAFLGEYGNSGPGAVP